MNLVYLLRTKTKTTRGCFELYCYVFLFFLPKKKYGFQWKFCFCRIKLKLCLSNWPVLILFWLGVFFTLGKNHGFCRFEKKRKVWLFSLSSACTFSSKIRKKKFMEADLVQKSYSWTSKSLLETICLLCAFWTTLTRRSQTYAAASFFRRSNWWPIVSVVFVFRRQ